MTRLFKITATGAIQVWDIHRLEGALAITYGQMHGVMQQQIERVSVNQSGRTLKEQVELRADSRINKQIDKGYCYTIELARANVGLNAVGLAKPMLACKLRDVTVDFTKCFTQYKYNGHRCLITNTGDKLIAYSRNGKPITTIGHILKSLENVIKPFETYDGELYIHNRPLQDLGSLIRKVQPGNEELRFVVYDIMWDLPYYNRLNELTRLSLGPYTIVAPTIDTTTAESVVQELHTAIEKGYEGLILRIDGYGYQQGVRSKHLIKVKQTMDKEFLVTAIHASADGWAILECQCGPHTFRVSAPGTISQKTEVLHNSHNYIGEWVTVEFFEWTNDNKPFHPVAIAFRQEA